MQGLMPGAWGAMLRPLIGDIDRLIGPAPVLARGGAVTVAKVLAYVFCLKPEDIWAPQK